MTDPNLARAVARAMTDPERQAFLLNWVTMNPRWQGANIADVLDELGNADAYLTLTEPIHASHAGEVPEPGLLYMASVAAAIAHNTLADPVSTFVFARAIIDRVRLDAAAWDASTPTQHSIEDAMDLLDASARRAGRRRGFRRFHLNRKDDATGISGTGIVAEGVQFSTGKVILGWTTRYRSVGQYDSMAEMVAIHGHDGRTAVEWVDEEGL